MYKLSSERCFDTENEAEAVYVETDPSGTYGRFKDVLGKGAMKTVYKAFDKSLGMEVAWNQAKLGDAFHSPMDLGRLYSEVHVLNNLKHDSVMRFYASWIDINSRTFNFITELFTSGTLREYTQKYKPVNIQAVKNWARHILRGLAYLHSHDPPVIHRDLKCANIFVNGHLGQVKMGDFGLAAILRGSQHAHSVIGTPEFMAPEIYEEEYNELVDIYSFGMCMIEMLTSEYPYSECSNPAQIYKKVTSGKLPAAFYRIQDLEARNFVGKCLKKVSERLPAESLLLDPFLAADQLEWPPPRPNLHSRYGLNLSKDHHSRTYQTHSTNMTITGTVNNEDDTIFLKVQISDKNGHTRNIYFPFDIIHDTAIEVSMEMVRELDISDLEPLEIAEMIEEEISTIVPTWKGWGTCQYNRRHSFICKVDYDVNDHSGFSSPSSQSSTQGSPRALISHSHLSGNNDGVYHWLQDTGFEGDETSSQSSMNSMKYSHMNYDDYNCNMEGGYDKIVSSSDSHLCCTPDAKKYTRFCPAEETKANQNHDQRLNSLQQGCCNQHPKLTGRRSYVDIRSQLLHRSLMLEINKRSMFNTVGSVENIGFQEPS